MSLFNGPVVAVNEYKLYDKGISPCSQGTTNADNAHVNIAASHYLGGSIQFIRILSTDLSINMIAVDERCVHVKKRLHTWGSRKAFYLHFLKTYH